jgi:hypothetical protein
MLPTLQALMGMNLFTRIPVVALIASFILLSGIFLSGCIAEDFSEVDSAQLDAGGDVADTGGDTADGETIDDIGDDVANDTDTSQPECQSNEECDGQGNQIGECDLESNTCSYTCEESYEDCDGEESNGCEAKIGSIDHCGGCGDSCTPQQDTNRAPLCEEGSCTTDPNACAAGYVDLDGIGDNGCECEISEPNDVPGGGDTNCDGYDGIIDGEDANVVFANPDAAGGADGLSPGSARPSLQAAIAAAANSDRSYVLAAGGSFQELIELRDGVSIYGGYDADNGWVRDTESRETIIEPEASAFGSSTQHYKSVIADGLTEPITIDHVTVLGVDATNPGASSYAVWVHGCDDLTISNSKFHSGAGADGTDGIDGITPTDASCNAAGGAGGPANNSEVQCANLGAAASGDPGNDGTQSNSGGTGGNGGAHSCGATAAGCSTTPGDGGTVLNGAAGTSGDNGEHGTPHGEIVGSEWSPAPMAEATSGGDGGGGGGGGAGGDCAKTASTARGGAGGHGGDGGCGATEGRNGMNGGGSFGLFIVDSTVIIDGGEVIQLAAVQGGAGGDGAAGQEAPDTGWTAGSEAGSLGGASDGGNGGFGGDGGPSGGGAGGCGGPTFGIASYASDVTVLGVLNETPSQGAQGGDGGAHGGPNASPAPIGCTGAYAFEYEFSPAPNQ